MELQVTRLTHEDLNEVDALDKVCFPEALAFPKSAFKNLLENDACINLAIREPLDDSHAKKRSKGAKKGRLVGFTIGLVQQDDGIVMTLDVHPEMRRQGLGRKLMHALEAEFARQGCVFSLLTVQVGNRPAIRLYECLGYRTVRTIPHYYPTGEDAYLMFKLLVSEDAAKNREST